MGCPCIGEEKFKKSTSKIRENIDFNNTITLNSLVYYFFRNIF